MTTENVRICDRGRRFGSDLLSVGRGVRLVGLGALAAAGEETRSLVDRLRARGEEIENRETGAVGQAYRQTAGKAKQLTARVEDRARRAVNSALHRAGVPNRDELRELIDRVEKLTARLDSLATDR